jgi:methyl-accepting chemotaxis protein
MLRRNQPEEIQPVYSFGGDMRFVDHIKVRSKLMISFAIMTILVVGIALVGYINLTSATNDMTTIYTDRLLPIESIGTAQKTLNNIQSNLLKYIYLPDSRSSIKTAISSSMSVLGSEIGKFKDSKMASETKASLNKFDTNWDAYQTSVNNLISLVDAGNTEEAQRLVSDDGEISVRQSVLASILDGILVSTDQSADELMGAANQNQTTTTIIEGVVGILAILLGVLLSSLLTSSIVTPIKVYTGSLNRLKMGDLSRELSDEVKRKNNTRRDELGDIGRALGATQKYLASMADQLKLIADGDLSIEVTPLCDKDELGIETKKMTEGLRSIVNSIIDEAKSLNQSSGELAHAANQSSEATSQIATTIQQIARGTAQTTASITKTANSVEELTRAIDGVAKGAQEQAAASSKSATITGQLSAAVQQVATNAQAVTQGADAATQAAKQGTDVVEETLRGMQTIKSKVDISAQKVQEMGSRSDQIGDIVVTIEDIASQTNLLALNAAIEAARAGEAGKGFAVVADEVRKLAERSALATKEISSLIRGIQSTVAEAVSAMNEGSKEVEAGVAKANKAGTALSDILTAAESVSTEAEQAAAAAEQMAASTNELVSSVDTVSAVVEENTASTEEMAASSGEVSQAIENIASVAEENSAAVEEVSASAEEMSAQVEEMTASASTLADQAKELQSIVNQFKLN